MRRSLIIVLLISLMAPVGEPVEAAFSKKQKVLAGAGGLIIGGLALWYYCKQIEKERAEDPYGQSSTASKIGAGVAGAFALGGLGALGWGGYEYGCQGMQPAPEEPQPPVRPKTPRRPKTPERPDPPYWEQPPTVNNFDEHQTPEGNVRFHNAVPFNNGVYTLHVTQITAQQQHALQCGYNALVYSRAMALAWNDDDTLDRNLVSQFAWGEVGDAQVQIAAAVQRVGNRYPHIGPQDDIGRTQLQFLMGIDQGGDPVFSAHAGGTGIQQTIWDEDYEATIGLGDIFRQHVIIPAAQRIAVGRPETFIIKRRNSGHWIAVLIHRQEQDGQVAYHVFYVDSNVGDQNTVAMSRAFFVGMFNGLHNAEDN